MQIFIPKVHLRIFLCSICLFPFSPRNVHLEGPASFFEGGLAPQSNLRIFLLVVRAFSYGEDHHIFELGNLTKQRFLC